MGKDEGIQIEDRVLVRDMPSTRRVAPEYIGKIGKVIDTYRSWTMNLNPDEFSTVFIVEFGPGETRDLFTGELFKQYEDNNVSSKDATLSDVLSELTKIRELLETASATPAKAAPLYVYVYGVDTAGQVAQQVEFALKTKGMREL